MLSIAIERFISFLDNKVHGPLIMKDSQMPRVNDNVIFQAKLTSTSVAWISLLTVKNFNNISPVFNLERIFVYNLYAVHSTPYYIEHT